MRELTEKQRRIVRMLESGSTPTEIEALLGLAKGYVHGVTQAVAKKRALDRADLLARLHAPDPLPRMVRRVAFASLSPAPLNPGTIQVQIKRCPACGK